MFVRDFEESAEVGTAAELEAFLARRFDKDGERVNSFWLSHVEDYPAMSLLVRGEQATLAYLGSEGESYASMGASPELCDAGTTIFYFDDLVQEVLGYQIIRVDEAVRAAKEFLETARLPTSLKWEEL